MSTHSWAQHLLAEYGFRRTQGRAELLILLAQQKKPVTVEFLQTKLSKIMDRANLYRALDAFVSAGLLARYGFGHNHTHYELLIGRPHHHHAICRSCGTIEDIAVPHAEKLEVEAQGNTRRFAHIDSHSLEFYGHCISCAR